MDKALVSTNRFFKRLEIYEKIKYSYTIDNNLISGGKDSQKLRAALYNAGIPKNNDYQNDAHHVIAINHPSAAISRGILNAVGIELNSATNGILLPSMFGELSPNWSITETRHNNHHNEDYFNTVNNQLIDDLEAYDEELSIIISQYKTEQEVQETLEEYINNDEIIKEELNKIICDCIFEIKIDLLNGELNL